MTYLRWPLFFLMLLGAGLSHGARDIVLKTRFDLESSQSFITELRRFLSNNGFGDPYSRELGRPINIDLAQALNEMPEDTRFWIRELQSVLRFDLFESDYQMVIENLSYSINDFNAEFKTGKSVGSRVDYVTINYVSGLRLVAEKIVFQVVLKQTQSREPIKFKVELMSPEFIISPELTAELAMGWTTKILPENFLISLDVIDIRKIMKRVVKSPDLIELNIKDMSIPKVSVRVGKKEVKFDERKIKNFFGSRKDEMKKGVLDLLNVRMNERFANILKDRPQEVLLPRTYGFKSDINGVFNIQNMESNNTGIVQLDFDGHFCEGTPLFGDEYCNNQKISVKNRRVIDEATYQRSLREVNRTLVEKRANVALSVSEEYLNQLVTATIKAGLWEDALKDSIFELGPEKAFVLAEEKGETFSLYLDIIYKLKSSERILVGRSELRFPVKFGVAVEIENKDDYPHFVIKVKKILTNHKLILEGVYNLPTNVATVPRFRGKILNEIMKEVNAYAGQTLLDLEIKELKGTYLKQLEFYSDGLGRGTGMIGFGKVEAP